MIKRTIAVAMAVTCMGSVSQATTRPSAVTKGLPTYKVRVSAYAPVRQCTDGTPETYANNEKVKKSHYYTTVALSYDLARKFYYGKNFILIFEDGSEKKVVFRDKMPRRFKKTLRIDWLMPTVRHCRKFGIKKAVLIPCDDELEG
jgi:hypothetical protein